MTKSDSYNSAQPQMRFCIHCRVMVLDEKHEVRDETGKVLGAWFSPASRYWNDEGVFCSAQHSLDYYQAKKGKS